MRGTALRTLAELGDRCAPVRADGAFYVLLRLRHPGDPMELVRRLVIDHRVAVLPGTAFGLAGCSLRIGYGALTPGHAADGIERLVTGILALT